VDSLLDVGLRLEFLHEFPFVAWRMFPFMEHGEDDWWRLPAGVPSAPLAFSLRARRDGGRP
jgi:hypothetical protein